MGRTYDAFSLKEIGARCAFRLPPAATVQAMFMYEIQRETDVQAGFEGLLSDVAKIGKDAQDQNQRISSIETALKEVQSWALSKDIEERLATSKARTDSLASRQNEHFVRLGDHSRRLTELESTCLKAKVDIIRADVEALEVSAAADDAKELIDDVSHVEETVEAVRMWSGEIRDSVEANEVLSKEQETILRTTTSTLRADIDDIKTTLAAKDKEIGILFDERDALLSLLEESKKRVQECNERIGKLEDNVRALTLQRSRPGSSEGARSPSVHFCPLTTKAGDSVDLVVPKGKGFVSEVKTFTPGKLWGS
jgi:chromosome segregation ATPase